MQYLKQSTAATIKLGPFVDDADGKTAESGLTISQADIRLSKNGGDFAQSNNSAGATHDESGYYDVPLNTTDTNTVGRLRVMVSESGALPVWAEFTVLPATAYDAMFAPSVTRVIHDGNDATSGATLNAAIAALADGQTLEISAGRFECTPFTMPDNCTIRGAGRTATVISFASGSNEICVTLGSYSELTDLTVRETVDGFTLGIDGSATATGMHVRNVFLDSANLECCEIVSTSACEVSFDDVWMSASAEWGASVQNAAHRVNMNGVTVISTNNQSDTDAKFMRVDSGAKVMLINCRHVGTPDGLNGAVLRVSDTSEVWMANCHFNNSGTFANGVGVIDIADATAYVTAVGCDFDRTNVVGNPANLIDQFSPLRATTPGRTLDVTATGAAGIDLGNVENQGSTLNLSATTIATLQDHTPQSGDAYAALTDDYGEPGAGAPPATTSLATKIGYLYKAWRNKKTQTGTTYRLYGDDGSTVHQEATVSDDGTTTTVGESSGP